VNSEQLARRISATLKQRGRKAYLVGGCVRDLLLGRGPKDFDVSTDATPEEVAALFPSSELVGAHFGVVLVHADGAQVEVATFRSEGAYSDGRRPDAVQFETDPRQDALRRDFTINALMLDPDSGEILDYAGGRKDLDAGLIRAIGEPETRFGEDHLRMLRAPRFAASLGFRIEPATAAAIGKLRASIREVAAERVRDELTRILTEGGARRGFEALDALRLLPEILPEVAAMKGVEQPPEFHPEGDVWTHTLLMLEGLRQPSVTLALGVLLHDVGKPPTFRLAERIRFDGHVEMGAKMAVGILGRLRFSAGQIERVEALVANHLRFKDAPRMRQSTLKRFLRQPYFEEHLELHRLDCLSSHRRLENYDFCREKLAGLQPAELKPAPLLSGHDLIDAGYRPGPAFARILTAVEDAQLEGKIHSREEALDLVRREFPPTPA
jgi:tRNA nucleotidyltransferase/poly(A) polymerase